MLASLGVNKDESMHSSRSHRHFSRVFSLSAFFCVFFEGIFQKDAYRTILLLFVSCLQKEPLKYDVFLTLKSCHNLSITYFQELGILSEKFVPECLGLAKQPSEFN